jgi:glycosyltransferase involved in cell wall biosynthesis
MVDDVPSFLQSGDIFVYTSISESGPGAVWEAMSMGKAIVTTDVGSVSQYIENGKSGFVVPVKDVEALTEKVELLLGDSALRQKMGAEARLVAEKYLDLRVAAEKHASFYRQILSLPKKP